MNLCDPLIRIEILKDSLQKLIEKLNLNDQDIKNFSTLSKEIREILKDVSKEADKIGQERNRMMDIINQIFSIEKKTE